MADVPELLERKQALLEQMQKPESERAPGLEHELQEIERALDRMESDRISASARSRPDRA